MADITQSLPLGAPAAGVTGGTGGARDTGHSVGIALDGAGWHPAAWREADAAPAELFTAPYWQRLVDDADRAGVDYVTIEDTLSLQGAAGFGGAASEHAPAGDIVEGRLDALLTASWLAPRTTGVGIIPTVTTTHTEPFHVATALQTLDHVAEGRAGWQLRISADPESAAAFGRRPAPEIDVQAVVAGEPDAGLDALLADAGDAAEVARRLWDSWEDGAIIRDVPTGRFLDRDRVHHINFESDRFSVVGPSIVPRSPQGQLPVTVLSHSPRVHALAAQTADVVFITPENPSPRAGASQGKSVSALVAEVRAAETVVDRAAAGLAQLRIVADVVVALDTDGEDAADRIARLDAAVPFASDAALLVGSATDVADTIGAWIAAGIDGVRIRPATIPTDLAAITGRLVPLLRERGILPDRARPTLRERFGLAPAANRYAPHPEAA